MNIGGIPVPSDDFALVIEQPAEFHPNDPAPVRLAFRTNLSRTTSLPNRMDQFDAVTVNRGEESRISEKTRSPVVMSRQETLPACSFWQCAKQRFIVALEPTVEHPKVACRGHLPHAFS
jgi:hypothetical protein